MPSRTPNLALHSDQQEPRATAMYLDFEASVPNAGGASSYPALAVCSMGSAEVA